MKKLLFTGAWLVSGVVFGQNSYPATGTATLNSGSDQTLILKDGRSGTNWNYLEWQFNDGTRDWVLGRKSTTGYFTLWRSGQNDVFTVDNTGKVGIGTSTPRGQFDVSGPGDIYLTNNTVSGSGQSAYLPGHIYVSPYAGSDWSYFQARRSDNSGSTNFQFRTWNAGTIMDALAIRSNGNIGIGTGSPSERLDLYDNAQYQAGIRATAALSGNSSFTLVAYTNGYSTVPEYANKVVLQTYNNPIALSAFGTGSNNQILFYTGGRTSEFKRMVLDENGNLGVGTTSPQTLLHVSNNGNNLLKIQSTAGGPGNTAGIDFCTWGNSTSRSARIETVDKGNFNGDLVFYTDGDNVDNSNTTEKMRITMDGKVGIGTISPDAKLAVKGQVHAQEVKVDLNGAVAPDYVFEKDYKLPSLEEIKSYIDQNKHLPEVPSAKEMEKNGVQLGEMNMLLLKKIEELTLYVIEQNKKMEILTEKIRTLETKK